MKNENKLITLIHRFYVLVKLNVLCVIFLILGLGVFTIQPVIRGAFKVIKEMNEGNIDGYSRIRGFFIPEFTAELKNFKKDFIPSCILIWIAAVLITANKYNNFFIVITRLILSYSAFIVVLYCLYKQFLNLRLRQNEEESSSFIENIVYIFFMPSNLVFSITILIISIFIVTRFPILNIVITYSLYFYLFFIMNIKKYDKFYDILKSRRNNLQI